MLEEKYIYFSLWSHWELRENFYIVLAFVLFGNMYVYFMYVQWRLDIRQWRGVQK